MLEYHESIDKSWVDLFTNDTFLKNNDPTSLANIIAKKSLPSEIFWSTIHESTHHWCFNSALGNTLFLLRFKTYLDALELSDLSERNVEWDILTNHMKYMIVMKIFRPLLEGMALFAENDCYPSPTEALPMNLLSNMLWFSKDGIFSTNEKKLSEIEAEYAIFLLNKRLSEEGINRKKQNFIFPLNVDKKCYLTGYLFVKILQGILIQKSDKFLDPNLFLYFLRNYFFYDLEFINILLDKTIVDEYSHVELCNYFSKRVSHLTKIDEQHIEEFELAIPKGDKNGTINILCDQHKVKEGKKKFEEEYNSLYQTLNPDKKLLFETLFFRRNLFKTAKLPAYIKIDNLRMKIYINYGKNKEVIEKWLKVGMHHVQVAGEYYFLMAAVPTETELGIEGSGFIEQFYDMENRKFSEVYWISDKIVHFQLSENFTEEDKMWFVLYYGNESLDKEISITQIINQSIDECYSNDKALKLIYDLVLNKTEEFTNHLYTTKCLNCKDENLEDNIKKMKIKGYYSILENTTYLDQLTKYSVLTSFSIIEKNEIKEYNDTFELDLPQEPIELYTKLKENGFFNLSLSQNKIVCVGL